MGKKGIPIPHGKIWGQKISKKLVVNHNAQPRISAIVPVYNVEKYLDRCFSSLTGQSLPYHEIILVDDGSSDSSGQMCDEYKKTYSNVKVIHQQNGGLSAARNAGISISSGDYLTFIDSDDWVSPCFNEVLYTALIATKSDISICTHIRAGDDFIFSSKQIQPNGPFELCEYSAKDYLDIMLRFKGNRCIHYAWGKLYRRSVIEADHYPVGLFNEDVEGCFKALLNSSRVVEVEYPGPLYCYFENNLSITGKSFGRNYLDLIEVWRRLGEITLKRAPWLRDKVQYNIIRTDFTVLCDMIIHGTAESDARFVDEAVLLKKRLRKNLKDLIKGPLPKGRKILAVCVAYGFNGIKVIYRAKRKIIGS